MSSFDDFRLLDIEEIRQKINAVRGKQIEEVKWQVQEQVEMRLLLIGQLNADMKNKFEELRTVRPPVNANILDYQTIKNVKENLTEKFKKEMDRDLTIGNRKNLFLRDLLALLVKMEEFINGRKKIIAELDKGLLKIRPVSGGKRLL
jgi:hypothetical protein